MTTKSTLVTGAGGFIGGRLVDELLRRGECVRALVHRQEQVEALKNRGVETVVGDIRDRAFVISAVQNADVVHHCAAAVGDYSEEDIHAINTDGVDNVLAAIAERGDGRLVLLSSINVLGNRNFNSASEDHPCKPSKDLRGDLKIVAEQTASEFHRSRGVDVAILRPATVYGPGDQTIPKLLRAIRGGKFVFIGSRENLVPLVHVDDVVQAMLLAAEKPIAGGRIYHIADGNRITIGQLVERLASLADCPTPQRVLPYALPWFGCRLFEILRKLHLYSGRAPINRVALKFLGTSRHVDISRAKEELGFEPRHPFPDGLEEAVRFAHRDADSTN